jgi:hypothetical protein
VQFNVNQPTTWTDNEVLYPLHVWSEQH